MRFGLSAPAIGAMPVVDTAIAVVGPVLLLAISVIAVRLLTYWRSFLFHWPRYRKRDDISTRQLEALPVPHVKIQVTTRGSQGSTEVIARGIRNVLELAAEAPAFYGRFLSVEIVTESAQQIADIERHFSDAPIRIDGLVLPEDYATENGTALKARGLHYAVERRRAGWNQRPGKTFIVHYDEESVMVPAELRKLIAVLATTDKRILEGPIYYPLEYEGASVLCRSMEANRPVGCFECREVMEHGVPLHLHGSNLVVEEALENEVGWDIGHLDGHALIAEDYVFGMKVFLEAGPEAFGWHGCVMLEQPPFSVRSAFKQRHRWVFGVLQGMAVTSREARFSALSNRLRRRVVWGTRFRIATFASGVFVGVTALSLLPFVLLRIAQNITATGTAPVSAGLAAWFAVVGLLWLGTVYIGAWYNLTEAGLPPSRRAGEVARAVALAPVAGIIESSAAAWAVMQWVAGKRGVAWLPTPKTREADNAALAKA